MQHDFWHARWRQGKIGFHQASTNPHLLRHWAQLGLPPDSRVLVPLCGKTLDMLYLAQQGHDVVGVELSETACRAFFDENDLAFETRTTGDYTVFKGTGDAARIELWCGDFFALTIDLVGTFAGFFDRAALIALPPTMRSSHVAAVERLVEPGGRGVLSTIEYPAAEKQGPPFPISPAEIHERYDERFDIVHIGQHDAADDARERWALTSLCEHVFTLAKR